MSYRFKRSFHLAPLAHAAVAVATICLLSAPVLAAGLLIADGGFGGALEIKEQDVKVTINNGVAVTEVEQVFLNKENRVVEALYTFPVPRGASVANFSMWINGKEMIGEVVEKERARQIYDSYKQQRRDPGLLEQVDYKRFEMRIFPIAAGAEQRVKIAYYQELDFDHDQATYVYPLGHSDAPRRTAAHQRQVCVDARRQERSADRANGKPVALRPICDCQAFAALLPGEPGDKRRRFEPRRCDRLPDGAAAYRTRYHCLAAARRGWLFPADADRGQGT